MSRTLLLDAATATKAGAAIAVEPNNRTFQATVTGTGAVGATVLIEGSNTGDDWLTVATITLSGTARASDGFASTAPWAMMRANLTAISGTGAAASVVMGY